MCELQNREEEKRFAASLPFPLSLIANAYFDIQSLRRSFCATPSSYNPNAAKPTLGE